MAGFLNIYAWWQRLRHSRGFGIHSPFAYRFITEVLNQPYAYYSYDKLRTDRERLIYRVALSFGPGRPCCAASPQDEKAARMALSDKGKICFVLIDCAVADQTHCARAIEHLAAGVPLMALNAHRCPQLTDAVNAMHHGMTFRNARSTIIAVPYPHLPLTHIPVRY